MDRHSLKSRFERQRSLRLGIAMDPKDFHFFTFSKQIESNAVKKRVENSFTPAVVLCLSHPVCSVYTFMKSVYCWAKNDLYGIYLR